MENVINIGLWSAYILIAGCAILAIVMPLIKAFEDPKVLIKGGAGTAVLLVVFLIGWAMSDGTAVGETTAGQSKLVGGALVTWYVLTFIAIGGIIYTEVIKMIK